MNWLKSVVRKIPPHAAARGAISIGRSKENKAEPHSPLALSADPGLELSRVLPSTLNGHVKL